MNLHLQVGLLVSAVRDPLHLLILVANTYCAFMIHQDPTALHISITVIFRTTQLDHSIIIPISQMRRVGYREIQLLAQAFPAKRT